MFDLAPRLYELRIRESNRNWRLFYRVDADRILLIHQINKTTPTLSQVDKNLVKERLATYDAAKVSAKPKGKP